MAGKITALEIEKTQVDSDLRHLSDSCFSELSESIEATCLTFFAALSPEELDLREQEYREGLMAEVLRLVESARVGGAA